MPLSVPGALWNVVRWGNEHRDALRRRAWAEEAASSTARSSGVERQAWMLTAPSRR